MSSSPPSNAATAANASKAKEAITQKYEELKKAGVVSIILQVFAGVIVTYLMYLVALSIMNTDKVVIDEKYDMGTKRGVEIINGFVDASMANVSFNTAVPFANNYLPIKPSVNIKGGAQFTYSMWLFIGSEATDSGVAEKILFLKGSNSKYNFRVTDNSTKTSSRRMGEHMVFCPMFKFGGNTRSFEVRFNTLNRYDEVMEINSVESSETTYRNNLLETVANSWVMITITFEDNVPINEFENGIMVKFYVNDTMYKLGRFSSALKQNHGDLYLFPNSSPLNGVKVSNFKYFNYVLSDSEIRNLAAGGANVTSSTLYMPPSATKPPVLSDYNKLDIYNI